MPELPEIYSRSKELKEVILGKTITRIEVIQHKSLNIPEDEFKKGLLGAHISDVTYKGKWIFVNTSQGWLMINLGMGGDLIYSPKGDPPDKWRTHFSFDDGSGLYINFWWFGYIHYIPHGMLETHMMTAKLGPNAVDLSIDELTALVKGKRGRIKNILLDQSKVAGIGNAYIHDILFLAGLHPFRMGISLTSEDIQKLHKAIHDGLVPSMEKGGAFYEKNIYGEGGGFVREDIIIGYSEGEPCPNCTTPIEKIKTGANSSYICPTCQAQ